MPGTEQRELLILFPGRVDVHVNSSSPRDHFLIHVKHLNIESARLYRGETKENEIDLIESMEYERNEFFVMRTEATVGEGKYIMSYGEEREKGQPKRIVKAHNIVD